MRILGIDNGLDGGLVLLMDGKVSDTHIMPTVGEKGREKRAYDQEAIFRVIETLRPDHAFLEWAQAMPGQGVTSMFSIGFGFGLMQGLLVGRRVPTTLVRPQAWQKVMFAGQPKGDTKSTSYLVCSKAWPEIEWRRSEKCRTPHSGLTDAACIAEYGRRQLQGWIGDSPAARPEAVLVTS